MMYLFVRRFIKGYISLLVMFRCTSGFLSRSPSRRSLSSSIYSKLDDLMQDVLSQGFTAAANSTQYNKEKSSSETGWRLIDWSHTGTNITPTPPSPVEVVMVRDRLVYLKRDDQLRLPGSHISGNKARKMLTLNQMNDFPTCVVSYGGPQSNAMLALAAVVHFQNERAGITDPSDPKRKRFVYYTKKLPRFLRNQPSGNLFRAQSLGMELEQLSPQEYNDLFGGEWGGPAEAPLALQPPVPGDSLWVPQGGACGMAVAGTRLLAEEILTFWAEHGQGRPLSVCIPGGTCSTAALLHRALLEMQSNGQNEEKMDIQVVVVPCVGDDAYARRQMMALNAQIDSCTTDDIPTILPPFPNNSYFGQPSKGKKGYFAFGEPDLAILETFREMKDEHQIGLDLLYGAPSWTVLLRHWRTEKDSGASFDPKAPLAGREVMYVCSGGLEGVNSQLLRYRYKGLVELEEIQLPGKNKLLKEDVNDSGVDQTNEDSMC